MPVYYKDVSIDFATATIGSRDAVYDAGSFPGLDPDTSDGWVTLGDGGSLTAGFSDITLTGSSMYLFVGEVGQNETLRANVHVDFKPIPAPGAMMLSSIGIATCGWLRRRKVF